MAKIDKTKSQGNALVASIMDTDDQQIIDLFVDFLGVVHSQLMLMIELRDGEAEDEEFEEEFEEDEEAEEFDEDEEAEEFDEDEEAEEEFDEEAEEEFDEEFDEEAEEEFDEEEAEEDEEEAEEESAFADLTLADLKKYFKDLSINYQGLMGKTDTSNPEAVRDHLATVAETLYTEELKNEGLKLRTLESRLSKLGAEPNYGRTRKEDKKIEIAAFDLALATVKEQFKTVKAAKPKPTAKAASKPSRPVRRTTRPVRRK